jgi:hypothetical protein
MLSGRHVRVADGAEEVCGDSTLEFWQAERKARKIKVNGRNMMVYHPEVAKARSAGRK